MVQGAMAPSKEDSAAQDPRRGFVMNGPATTSGEGEMVDDS